VEHIKQLLTCGKFIFAMLSCYRVTISQIFKSLN